MSNILLIGSSGLLGQNLKIEADKPTHKELDITGIIIPKKYDLIVLVAAYTDTTKAEIDRWNCFNVNCNGVINVLESYPNTPIVYISSEYANNPVNFYSLTKSIGEQLVTFHTAPNLIIRTLFKPHPYPYQYAFTDQYTLGSNITDVAPMIDGMIKDWDRKESKTVYTDFGRKTLFELAKKTKPDVKGNTTAEWSKITGVKYPTDYDKPSNSNPNSSNGITIYDR